MITLFNNKNYTEATPVCISVFTVLLSALFMVSCGSVGTVDVPPVSVGPTDVVNVMMIEPYAEIQSIENKKDTYYSEPLSYASAQLIKEAIIAENYWVPVTDTISIKDDATLLSCKSFMRSFQEAKGVDRYRVPVPVLMDSLIESTGHRFGMIVWGTGFERSQGNYRKAEALSVVAAVLTGIITLGTMVYVPMPYKGSLTLNVALIDTRDDCVVYHNTVSVKDKKPTDYSVVNKKVKELFSDYYSPGYQIY